MADARTDFGTTIPERIRARGDASKAIGAVFVFNITGAEGGTWTVNVKDDLGVTEGNAPTPADCTLELSADDWQTMSATPSAAMALYFAGKLKVTGNPMLATKLQELLA